MSDYLEQIAAAKAELTRLKGEKETFEQSNEPDDADEEELKSWNYAKDLERQIRELKSENKDALKQLAKLKKTAAKPKATDADRHAACATKAELKTVLDQIAALEAALVPYEQIKRDLTAARSCFRKLTDEFVSELKNRCGFMGDENKRSRVLELMAQDIQRGLDGAVTEKRQMITQFVETIWDKYRLTLTAIRGERKDIETRLNLFFGQLNYQ